jgi:hypothetical protein
MIHAMGAGRSQHVMDGRPCVADGIVFPLKADSRGARAIRVARKASGEGRPVTEV